MNFGKLADIFKLHAEDLHNLHDKTARFRAASYGRVAEKIEAKYDLKDKVSKTKIEKLELTPYMMQRVNEVINGKELALHKDDQKRLASRSRSMSASRSSSRSLSRSSSRSLSRPSSKLLVDELTTLMGIGKERAKQLVADGLTNLSQLKSKKWLERLPEETRLFMQLKPSEKIPHDDIKKIEPYLLKLQTTNMKLQLVGSYRRKKATSRDIDVMIVSKDLNILNKFLKALSGIFKVYPYSKGDDKMSVVLDASRLLNKRAVYTLDAFRVEPENQIPMLLYSTGSKTFNVIMRGRAKKMGLLLNQNGLFKKEGNKMTKIKGLKSEADYFKIMGMAYKEPKDRS